MVYRFYTSGCFDSPQGRSPSGLSKQATSGKPSRPQARNHLTNLYDDIILDQPECTLLAPSYIRVICVACKCGGGPGSCCYKPGLQASLLRGAVVNKLDPRRYDLRMDDFVNSDAFEKRKPLFLKRTRRTAKAATRPPTLPLPSAHAWRTHL